MDTEKTNQANASAVDAPVSHKNFAPLIVVVIILFFISIGGAYYLGLRSRPLSSSTNNATKSNTKVASITPTTAIFSNNHTSTFISTRMGIIFGYPSRLGEAREGMDVNTKGEARLTVNFDEGGFIPGYSEISTSTSNYAPIAGEGSPHYINAKITGSDTIESVKQKLTAGGHDVVEVMKLKNNKNEVAFKAYTLHCYARCTLERFYILPNKIDKFGNISILTMLKEMSTAENDSHYFETSMKNAPSEIQKIETNTAGEEIKIFTEGQDFILNSLQFN